MSNLNKAKAKKPWANEEMTSITFSVFCGKPTYPINNPKKFTWPEKAPKSYCKRKTDEAPGPSKSILHNYSQELIDRYDIEMFESQEWKCAVCDCIAKQLHYSSVSNLAPPCDCHFIPSISVYAIPACHGHNNLNCGRIAFSMMDTYQEVLFPAHEMNPARCDMCNVKDGYMDRVEIKKCTGCKKVGYCSKECQRDHWKSHKSDCKRVQLEQSQPNYEPVQKWREFIFGPKVE